MALHTTRGVQNLPPGVLRVTKEEALNFQKSLVRDWKTESDVYSKHIASVLVAATTVPIWDHFRKILNLEKKRKITLFIPGTIIPTIGSYLLFDEIITNKVLLMQNMCPLCYVFPSGFFQIYNGVLHPILVGLINSLSLSPKTLNVPNPRTESKQYIKFLFQNVIKPGGVKFYFFASVHILSLMFLPYMQTKELHNISTQIERENLLENPDEIIY